MELKTQPTFEADFNWEALKNQNRRTLNQELLSKYGARVYSHAPYAEAYWLQLQGINPINKEVKTGQHLKVTGITSISPKVIWFVCEHMIDVPVNVEAEKRFFALYGLDAESYLTILSTPEGKESFVAQEHYLVLETHQPALRGSLYGGYKKKIFEELVGQLTKPSNAYEAEVLRKNDGGFLISVAGIEGFLPGSLAATNKIFNFDEYIGKKMYVMVEDYLKESDTFIFSYKKYLNHILPSKIEALNTEKMYTGHVTGTAKYGIFIEFDEIFTGLLHTSKMTPEMRDKFNAGAYRPGNTVEFWIREITPDKKIILTNEDPSIRQQEIDDFKAKSIGTIRGGEVISVKPFGALIKIEKDIVGLVSQREIKHRKVNYKVGDKVYVTVDRVQNNKVFLSIPSDK